MQTDPAYFQMFIKNETQSRIFKGNDPELWNRSFSLNACTEPLMSMLSWQWVVEEVKHMRSQYLKFRDFIRVGELLPSKFEFAIARLELLAAVRQHRPVCKPMMSIEEVRSKPPKDADSQFWRGVQTRDEKYKQPKQDVEAVVVRFKAVRDLLRFPISKREARPCLVANCGSSKGEFEEFEEFLDEGTKDAQENFGTCSAVHRGGCTEGDCFNVV
jgi:hypothetical protein